MDPATAVQITGLVVYCLLYTVILYFWVFSFARDLRLVEDNDGRQQVQGCCTINERSLPKLFYFFLLASLFGAVPPSIIDELFCHMHLQIVLFPSDRTSYNGTLSLVFPLHASIG